jgi:hypothetical protein
MKMKNYSQWMNQTDNSEDLVYEMASKDLVKINGSETDYEVIINDTNEWQKEVDLIWLVKKNVFIPNIGDYIKYKDLFYLNVHLSEERETYWSSKARLCNSTFPIQTNKTSVLVGTDDYGRPEYEYAESIKQEPCIVEPRYFFKGMTDQMTNPQDSIAVTLKYQESDSLQENHEFDMYKSKYKITFIDYSKVINGKGVITVTGERVIKDGGI